MTNGNRYGKIAALCLISLGIAWVGNIAFEMYQGRLFPWQYRTAVIQVPETCKTAIVYTAPPSPGSPACTKGEKSQ
jgi:hypothetical protein